MIRIRKFLCRLGFHWWTYYTPRYNPYRRECTHCKRLEVEYCNGWANWNRGYWECHDEGTP